MRLKDLDTWNSQREQDWANKLLQVQHPEWFGNGFACPVCGGELYDTGQQMSLHPPRLRVKCTRTRTCSFKGERLE